MANTMLLMWCVIMGVAFSSTTTTGVHGKKPPATFIFGDSLVDAGNNNYIFTLAAANHKPYGIDWPDQQATGRFCNGKIIPDLINDYLGTPAPLPVLAPDAQGANLLNGVNMASAGAGILEETGSIFVRNFTQSTSFMSLLLGAPITPLL